jgi:hypothetical protein
MGIQDGEETLTATLIDPETLDNPTPTYLKGEPQDPKCRDAWAAILFYAQFIAVCCVCGILGVPALQKNIAAAGDSSGGGGQEDAMEMGKTDYTGLIYSKF